jgi:hypothetical protein
MLLLIVMMLSVFLSRLDCRTFFLNRLGMGPEPFWYYVIPDDGTDTDDALFAVPRFPSRWNRLGMGSDPLFHACRIVVACGTFIRNRLV